MLFGGGAGLRPAAVYTSEQARYVIPIRHSGLADLTARSGTCHSSAACLDQVDDETLVGRREINLEPSGGGKGEVVLGPGRGHVIAGARWT